MTLNLMIILDLQEAQDPAEFEDKVRGWQEKGLINRQFILWLDDCIDGKKSCGLDVRMLALLRDEIKGLVWISPEMPSSLLKYYEAMISEAIESQPVVRIPAMVATLKERFLLTEAFCSLFRQVLGLAVDEHRISCFDADNNWEIFLESVGPEMSAKFRNTGSIQKSDETTENETGKNKEEQVKKSWWKLW